MVVSCQKCRTRFQLDEGRIPAKGVRVRCSKCKHAFFVAPPATRDDTLHRLAQQAAVQGKPTKVKPGPTHDLPLPGGGGEPEDDWQFNIDPPGGSGDGGAAEFDEASAPPAEITDSEPTESESVDGFFELDGLTDPGPEEGRSEPPAAAAPPAAAKAGRPAKGARPRSAETAIEPEQEVTFEDLGRPETWDFGAAEAPRSAAPAKPSKAAQGGKQQQKKKKSEAVQAEPAPVAASASGASWRPREGGLAGSVGGAVGWLLVVGLFGFALHGATLSPPATEELATLSVGALELADLRVRHVENLFAGPLVVLSGELRNPSSDAARFDGAPRVRITDAAGEPVDAGAGWLGLGIAPEELRRTDPAILTQAQAHSARELAARSFDPQDRVSVTALLGALPAAGVAFEVEAAPLSVLPPEPEPAASEPAAGEAGVQTTPPGGPPGAGESPEAAAP